MVPSGLGAATTAAVPFRLTIPAATGRPGVPDHSSIRFRFYAGRARRGGTDDYSVRHRHRNRRTDVRSRKQPVSALRRGSTTTQAGLQRQERIESIYRRGDGARNARRFADGPGDPARGKARGQRSGDRGRSDDHAQVGRPTPVLYPRWFFRNDHADRVGSDQLAKKKQ